MRRRLQRQLHSCTCMLHAFPGDRPALTDWPQCAECSNATTLIINSSCRRPCCNNKNSHCVSLHATCCTGTAPAGSDASVGDSEFATGTTAIKYHGNLQTQSLPLCQKAPLVKLYCCMQANSSLPLRFWLDEYAFTPGETTLLKEEIEVCVIAACQCQL